MGNTRNWRQVQQWTPQQMEALHGVPIPPKIKCGRCSKNLTHVHFSETQKTKLRWQIKNNVRNGPAINCQRCSGARVDELMCNVCNKWKGLEDYAKSRRVPDNAQCFACTEKQVKHKPVVEEHYEDENKAFITPDSSNGIQPDYWIDSGSDVNSATGQEWTSVSGGDDSSDAGGGVRLTETFGGLSLGSNSDASLIDTEDMYPSRGNASRPSRSATSWRSPSSASVTAGSRSSARTAASVVGTERSYPSSMAERSAAPEMTRSGFARIRAAVPDGPARYGRASPPPWAPPMRPDGDAQRESDADTACWDSDDDEEDEQSGGDSDDDSDGENTVL